ncbi:MAG: D-arabinono-1,4-lactone oxidase, partial [Cellulomonadaceae bacterium]
LGTVGVLTAVTLAVEPAYVLEAVEEPWALDRIREELQGPHDVVSRNEHFEFFWFPHTRRALTKRNNRVAVSDRPLGRVRSWVDDELMSNRVYEVVNRVGALAPRTVPVLNQLSARGLGARRFTAPSSEVFVSARRVRFRESEWAVPRPALAAVLDELERWLARAGRDVSFPVEVRFAAPEDVWLSTAHGRDTAYVAVHQFHRGDHRAYFAAVQQIMTAHGGRPHWGKMHDVGADYLAEQYPRLADFARIRADVDPDGVFLNPYTRTVLGLEPADR